MKCTQTLLFTAMAIAVNQPVLAHADAECGDTPHPLLTVADFDADGKVTGKDVAMIIRKKRSHGYYALYDLNADGELDWRDIGMTMNQVGSISTALDQWLATQYNRFEYLQGVSGKATLMAMGYQQLGGPLQGHGVHWMNESGMLAVGGLGNADQTIAQGLNVLEDGSDIPAMFWGEHAVPLFNDPGSATGLSTLDFPSPGGAWMFERVQAFGGSPPDFIPDVDENWHTHAGTCLTYWDYGNGPEWRIDQYMSAMECQMLPNLAPFLDPTTGTEVNLWSNFWMMHVWLFDLNPRGVFANVHPCVSQTAPDEEDTNGGREVPVWFQEHGGHGGHG